MEPLAVGIPEAGKAVGLSKYTVAEKVRKGEIKAIHIGRRIVIEVSELRAFLQRQAEKTP